MCGLRTTSHIIEVSNDSKSGEKCAVHPSSPLFDQDGKIFWSVSKSFSIRDIRQVVSRLLLDVDLKTHHSILCEILISLAAGGV